MSTPDSGAKWFTPFLMLACVALAIVVVMLVRSNRQLKADNASLQAEASKAMRALEAKSLGPGDAIGELKLQGTDGMWNTRSFVTSGSPPHSTLMLIASHGCEVCEAMGPLWETVLNGPHPGCDAILIYTDGATGPRDAHEYLPVARYQVNNGKATSLGKLTLVPATILIGPDGIIDKVWYGMLTEDDMREISDEIADAGK